MSWHGFPPRVWNAYVTGDVHKLQYHSHVIRGEKREISDSDSKERERVEANRYRGAITAWLLAAAASFGVAVLSGANVILSGDCVKRTLIAATWTAVGLTFVGRFFSIRRRTRLAERPAEGEDEKQGSPPRR